MPCVAVHVHIVSWHVFASLDLAEPLTRCLHSAKRIWTLLTIGDHIARAQRHEMEYLAELERLCLALGLQETTKAQV